MTDKILIKPWEVRGEGREFESISGDFGQATAKLEHELAGLGAPWGQDEPGSGFGGSYSEASEGVLAGLHGLAGRLSTIGSGLRTMADNADRNEEGVRADFSGQSFDSGQGGGTAGGPVTV